MIVRPLVAFPVVGVLGVLIGDAIINANPFVAMIVSPHAVVEHIPPLLDKSSQVSSRLLVLGVLTNMAHHQYYMLAHYCALNGCAAVVQQVSLILFDCLLYAIIEHLSWRCILQTESPLNHLV